MQSLKRSLVVLLLAVAVLAAVRVPATADTGPLRVTAQPCHCLDGCAPDTGACKEHGSCTATCAGGIFAGDVGFALLVPHTHQSVASDRVAALRTVTHPPPLQPPRA